VVMAPFDLAGPAKPRRKKPKARKAVWDHDLQIFVDPQRAAEVKATIAAQHAKPLSAVDAASPFDGDQTVPNPPAQIPEPAAAVTAEPIAAGIALRAEDTGRVLMLQRALDDNDGMPDANAGKFELPGGHINDGETPWAGAAREFGEEVGQPLPPDAKVNGTWVSADGIYAGFVVDTATEMSIDINADAEARKITNPDGDRFETCVWMDPNSIPNNPVMRHEVAVMDWRVLIRP
jgi:8-oxo-dGTP pyrophosphatase MutT (NUDIX family)